MAYKKSEKLKKIRKAIESGKSILDACREAGIRSRDTIFQWGKKNPRIHRYFERLKTLWDDTLVETAETALHRMAQAGNLGASIFILTNRAQGRWADRRAVVNNTVVNKIHNENSQTTKISGNEIFKQFSHQDRAQIIRDLCDADA